MMFILDSLIIIPRDKNLLDKFILYRWRNKLYPKFHKNFQKFLKTWFMNYNIF